MRSGHQAEGFEETVLTNPRHTCRGIGSTGRAHALRPGRSADAIEDEPRPNQARATDKPLSGLGFPRTSEICDDVDFKFRNFYIRAVPSGS